jgi:hypothetical protein
MKNKMKRPRRIEKPTWGIPIHQRKRVKGGKTANKRKSRSQWACCRAQQASGKGQSGHLGFKNHIQGLCGKATTLSQQLKSSTPAWLCSHSANIWFLCSTSDNYAFLFQLWIFLVLKMTSDLWLCPGHFGYHFRRCGFYLNCSKMVLQPGLAHRSWPTFISCGSNES